MNLGSTLESWATLTLASWNKHSLRFKLSLKERRNYANLIQFFKFCQGIGSFLSSNFFMFIGVILSNVTCWWNHVRVIVFICSDILLVNRYAFHLLLEMILKSKLTINWGIIDRPLLSITSCRNGCCWGVTISVDRNYTCGCWSCLRIEIFLKIIFKDIMQWISYTPK